MFSSGRLVDLIEPSDGESQSQASLLLHYEKSSQVRERVLVRGVRARVYVATTLVCFEESQR